MHSIEPELMQPPPRRLSLVLRAETRTGAGCVALFFLPFMVIGIYTFVQVLHASVVLAFHRTAEAQITDKREDYDSESGSHYRVFFTFRVGERTYRARDEVECAAFGTFSVGNRVRVHYLPLTPGWHAFLEQETTFPSRVRFHWGFTLFWNAILSVFIVPVCLALRRARALVRFGTPVVGTIVEKSTQSQEDSTRYLLRYVFEAEDHGGGRRRMEKEETVSQEEWDGIREGEELTVLYMPGRPDQSGLYRFETYHAI
jgi:hypothetical protein